MAIECGAITGVFLLFVLIFLRTKRKEWALATLPLTLVPLADFVLELIVVRMMKVEVTAFAGILVLVVAVAASAAWIGAAAGTLRHKRTKASYIGISNAFNIALAAILIYDILVSAGKLESLII
ncbi:MAG: hypothetical protein NC299_04125 [Lachnospiraceae bacterium]|nr:hypothetical protein [Ruminococcus sp.]MCM1274534.1 hypothetical protein [Lachnospiraceae bacterium]